MGVETLDSPAIGGGVPFCMLLGCSPGAPQVLPECSFPPPFPAPIVANFQAIGAHFRQKGAKVRFSLVCFGVFSGKSETENGKNKDIFYFRAFVVLLSSSFVVAVACPPIAGGQAFGLVLCFRGVFRPFVRFTAMLAVRWLEIWLYLAF